MTFGCCSEQGLGWDGLKLTSSKSLCSFGRGGVSWLTVVPSWIVSSWKPSGAGKWKLNFSYWICFSSPSDPSWTSPCFRPTTTLPGPFRTQAALSSPPAVHPQETSPALTLLWSFPSRVLTSGQFPCLYDWGTPGSWGSSLVCSLTTPGFQQCAWCLGRTRQILVKRADEWVFCLYKAALVWFPGGKTFYLIGLSHFCPA